MQGNKPTKDRRTRNPLPPLPAPQTPTMLTAYDYMRGFSAPRVHPRDNKILVYQHHDMGCGSQDVARVEVHGKCPIALAPIVVDRPRPEYTSNLYHAMEEVYSLHQTAWLLGIDLSKVDLIFVQPHLVNPRIRELFKVIMRSVTVQQQQFRGACSIRPLRACSGSYLPYSWSHIPKARPDPFSLDLRRSVLGRVNPVSFGGEMLLMTRRHASKRQLRRVDFFRQCMQSVGPTRLFEGLASYPMVEQIRMVASSRALVGPHGAGLTLSMFVPHGGALIEVIDASGVGRGRSVAHIYSNLAHFTDHLYLQVPTSEPTCQRIRHVLSQTLATDATTNATTNATSLPLSSTNATSEAVRNGSSRSQSTSIPQKMRIPSLADILP